jgi:hypothetical protein
MMTYKERLCCWAIARLLPSQQWMIVARFRSLQMQTGIFSFCDKLYLTLSLRLCSIPVAIVTV